jgi:deoxyadenosine/deoxycytidine kinase
MCKLIAFSGASNSGKTTAIKRSLEKHPHLCVELDEIIRRKKAINIDTLRSNPMEYLKFQQEVTLQKIEEELDAVEKYKNTDTLILVDRSIVDSLFYCAFYLDKSKFSDSELMQYRDLYAAITDHIKNHPYHKILIFQPIQNIQLDNGLRTSNLRYFQDCEDFFIRNLSYSCFGAERVIDVATQDIDKLVNTITDL